ncbi:MAG TPA: RNA 2',3'-cyclic phosphodiesterase [candidate division Zixibacteria bacterium]|nr:RNA 2',3'-cyclic phosphodiesterase [candidate division Zixibacteria bacterium]
MMRLFIAAPISSEVEKELSRIISALKNIGGQVKWVAPSNIHLTLKFLGDTDEKLVPQIKNIMDETASKHSSVSSGLSGLGAFPDYRRPRVFWAGLERGAEELSRIAGDIDRSVHTLGFDKENRPFKAHLTLGRVKFPQGLEKLCDVVKVFKVEPKQFIFDRIVLFKSTLTPRGSIYDVLHESKLK